jgi:hypothetical protein
VYFVEAFNPALDILGQQLKDSGVRGLASVVAFILNSTRLLPGSRAR